MLLFNQILHIEGRICCFSLFCDLRLENSSHLVTMKQLHCRVAFPLMHNCQINWLDFQIKKRWFGNNVRLNSTPEGSCYVSGPSLHHLPLSNLASLTVSCSYSNVPSILLPHSFCPELFYLLRMLPRQRYLQSLSPHFLYASAQMSLPHIKQQHFSPSLYLAFTDIIYAILKVCSLNCFHPLKHKLCKGRNCVLFCSWW